MHVRDLTQFLNELGENNNRAWFVMNKPRYDILREEFLALVSGLIVELAKFDPLVAPCQPKKALFRINRDIRFARDKSPYKTRFSAAIAPRDLRRPSVAGGPTYYLHLDGQGKMLFGVGEFMPPAGRLRAIRESLVNDAAGFAKVLKNKKLRTTFGPMREEAKLVRPPKGFDANAQHIEYIKLKSFFVWTEVAVPQDGPEQLVAQLASGFKDAFALVTWLRAAKERIE